MKRALTTLILGGAAMFGSSGAARGAEFEMEYTTEWQTDFRGRYAWLNLLTTSTEVSLTGPLTFHAATVSTARAGDSSLADDLLTYSNIDAPPIPLTLSRLGLSLDIGPSTIFAGIGNVNTDYFTSPFTAYFTNSSCGISPTISYNFDIANYPVAAWCLHYRLALSNFAVQTSLYPGRGYSRLLGHDNIFSLRLRRDGFFSISSLEYTAKSHGIHTVMGIALHRGHRAGDAEGLSGGTEAPSSSPSSLAASPWVLGEFTLPRGLGLLLHASLSTVDEGCRNYLGLGLLGHSLPLTPAISYNYATFRSDCPEARGCEHDIELTATLPLFSDRLTLQPALHILRPLDSPWTTIALLRLTWSI